MTDTHFADVHLDCLPNESVILSLQYDPDFEAYDWQPSFCYAKWERRRGGVKQVEEMELDERNAVTAFAKAVYGKSAEFRLECLAACMAHRNETSNTRKIA